MKFLRHLLIGLALAACALPALAQDTSGTPPINPNTINPAPTSPDQTSPDQTGPAPTSPAANPSITPAEAAQTLGILQDDRKRDQLIQTLRTIAKVAPGQPAASTPPPIHAKAAAPAAAKPAAATPAIASVPANGLAHQLLVSTAVWADHTVVQLGATARAITDFPILWRWLRHLATDPVARALVLSAVWKLAAVLACGLAAEWLLILLLRGAVRSLERHAPSPEPAVTVPAGESAMTPRRPRLGRTWQALQRLPFALAFLILQLIPIAAFALLANLLPSISIIDASGTVRLAIMSVLNAYVLLRAVLSITRLFVSYEHPQLALVRLKPENAAYVEVWVRRIAMLALFGIALAEVAALLGLASAAHAALLKFVALLVHICLLIIVLQCRSSIADVLRAPEDAHGMAASVRNRLADIWHFLAIFLIIASWVILAVQSQNGTDLFIRFVLLTIAVLAVARLLSIVALGTLDRVFHLHPRIASLYPGLEDRANRYYQLLRGTVAGLIWIGTLVALLEAWGVNSLAWFTPGHMGDRLVSALITIAIAAVIAIAIWESVNATLERHVARLVREDRAQRVMRIKTLLPILRTSLLIAIVVILGLTVLNQVGVNIGPLLAGAGIVGVAVGFGSQKLVQDLITGLFLLFENAMQVGDWVTAGGLSGSVETLSIRTVRLRAGDGSLHIIPFSAVTAVTNTNRGIGNAAVSVNVDIREDPDQVGDVLKAIAAEIRADPNFGPVMRSDLQLWGVDKVDASVMTIVGQIVCTDAGRWGVQREFNRRMKMRFQELGIRIANPAQTILIEQPAPEHPEKTEPEAEAEAAASPSGGANGSSAANVKDSPPPTALGHNE